MESKHLDHKAKPLANYPHIKRVGDFLFVSGTSARQKDNTVRGAVPDGKGGWQFDIREQTRGVIENVRDILASCEATLTDLCEVTVFLVDMTDFAGYNEVYNSYFTVDGPTRTTVAVTALPRPDLIIEMKAVAYKPRQGS
ncbi:MAG: RidA family protein [Candidatus Binatia bacterium]